MCYLAYKLQSNVEGIQGKNPQAGAEEEAMGKCCLLAC